MSTKDPRHPVQDPSPDRAADAAAALRRTIEPEGDLWAGVSRRIDASHSRSDAKASPATLPRQIEPNRDLWPCVRRRLEGREPARDGSATTRPSAWTSWVGGAGWAVAAAALVLAFQLPGSDPGERAAGTTAPFVEGVSLPIDQVQADRRAARVRLRRVLLEDQTISAATRRTIERNLATIDRALREIQQALAEDPGNATLYRLLHATYRQEAEIVAQVTRRDRRSGDTL